MRWLLTIVVLFGLAPLAATSDERKPQAGKPKLPKPLDHIAYDDKDFSRFFIVEGPRFAKEAEVAKAGKEDTLVWTLKAKEPLDGKILVSIMQRRFAVFHKDEASSSRRDLEIARLRVQIPAEYARGEKNLKKREVIQAWVHLEKDLPTIRKQAAFMRIDIELE